MPALREVQARFAESLLAGDDPTLLDLVDGDGLDPRARLAVYRHHVLTTLTATLEQAYPVVCWLVDERFFAFAADAFIKRHPPAGPCLAEYGAGFPDFLAGFPACAGLPYLPDTARLEWAVHVAAQQTGRPPLDRARLTAVDPSDMAQLRFVPDPGVALLASPWPIDRIWRAYREEGALPDLGGRGVCLQVRTAGENVAIRALEPGTYVFRDALARGLTLGEATALTLESHASFDLTPAIREVLDEGIFNDVTLNPEEGGRSCR
ncbi:MAG TPA: DNA-binding domain-containing protein [Methylomirabilota bacterium]|nr:DNA-binding domain-containing protein [Methylomirabilota bacterium]